MTDLRTYLEGKPLAIAPNVLEQIRAGEYDDYDDDMPDPEVVNTILSIPVVGVLVNRDHDAWYATSYEWLGRWIAHGVESDEVTAIVLDIDSPGGEAAGMAELSMQIREARAVKPVYAVANTMMTSAAYGIGSAASKVFGVPHNLSGSIGVITSHTDISEYYANLGIKQETIKAGAKKDQFSMLGPLSDEARELLQHMVDSIYEEFTALVAQNRGVSQESIKAQQAAVYHGRSALEAGLIDNLTPAADAISQIISEVTEMTKRKEPIAAQEPEAADQTPEPTASQDVPEPETNTPEPAAADIRKLVAQETRDAIAQSRKVAAEITAACARIDRSDLAAELIETCETAEQAKVKLFDLAADAQPALFNNPGDPAAGEDRKAVDLLVNQMKEVG